MLRYITFPDAWRKMGRHPISSYWYKYGHIKIYKEKNLNLYGRMKVHKKKILNPGESLYNLLEP